MDKSKLMLLAFFTIAAFMLTIVSASSISDRTLGKENAPVTIEMFADFECPYCSMWHTQTFSLIKENYVDTGKVKLIVRYFPIEPAHPKAKDAAIYSQCAADQGKFFEYVDTLYNSQDSLDTENLRSYASDLNLDLEEFDYCISDSATLEIFNKDIQRANSKNVKGTPTFFINGKGYGGAQPYSAFENYIELALSNESPYSCIDFNKDRVNDNADIDKLTDYAFGGVEIPEGTNADLNEDGVVNILDVTVLTNYIIRDGPAPKCAIVEPSVVMNSCGDTNTDDTLDQTDLDAITSYAFEGIEVPSNVNADLNNDSVVDILDVVLMTNYVKRNGEKPSCANKVLVEKEPDADEENTVENPVPSVSGNGNGGSSGGSSGSIVVITTNTGNSGETTTEAQEDTSLEEIEQRLDDLEQKVDENDKTLEKILKILGRFFRF